MNNKFYEGLDSLFDSIVTNLEGSDQSKNLQDTIYNLFETYVYASLINTLFSNLKIKNVQEFYGISDKKLQDFLLNFKEVLYDIEKGLKIDNSIKIDSEYYNNFKQNVESVYPDFSNLINDFEIKFEISKLSSYLDDKKKQFLYEIMKEDFDRDFIISNLIEESFQNSGVLSQEFKDFNSKLFIDSSEESMKIKEWKVRHYYSTFFLELDYKLQDIIYKLVEINLCPLILSQNLKLCWKENNQVKETALEINKSNIKIRWPNIFNKYLLECLNQFSMILNGKSNLNMGYSKLDCNICFMNPCKLRNGNKNSVLYPQLILYGDGKVKMVFRELTPTKSEEFTKREIDPYNNDFDQIETAPEIMKLSGREYMERLIPQVYDAENGKLIIKEIFVQVYSSK